MKANKGLHGKSNSDSAFEKRREHQLRLLHDAEEIEIYRKHFLSLRKDLETLKKRSEKTHQDGLKLRRKIEQL